MLTLVIAERTAVTITTSLSCCARTRALGLAPAMFAIFCTTADIVEDVEDGGRGMGANDEEARYIRRRPRRSPELRPSRVARVDHSALWGNKSHGDLCPTPVSPSPPRVSLCVPARCSESAHRRRQPSKYHSRPEFGVQYTRTESTRAWKITANEINARSLRDSLQR